MENGCQNILHQTDHNAIDGTQAEGRQQCGQFGHIHLDKGGNQHGKREIQHHQHTAHGRQHGGDHKGTNRTFGLHNIPPGRLNRPSKKFLESRQQMEPGGLSGLSRATNKTPCQQNTLTGRTASTANSFRFFHPDYTVGFGISPNQRTAQKQCGRGLYRRWGISPRPETDFLTSIIAKVLKNATGHATIQISFWICRRSFLAAGKELP